MIALLKLTVLLSLVAASLCNDVRSGYAIPNQRLIFEQNYDYQPSIYLRSENINVDTHGDEIISQIEIIDRRELKDGVAVINSGGVGQRSVSISIKGPAVFRGMTFTVRVWAANVKDYTKTGSDYEGFQNGVQRVGEFVNGLADTYKNKNNGELHTGINNDAGHIRADTSRNCASISYGTGNGDAKIDYDTKAYEFDQQIEDRNEYAKNLNSYTKQ